MTRALLLVATTACVTYVPLPGAGDDASDPPGETAPDGPTDDGVETDVADTDVPLPWTDDPCAPVDAGGTPFGLAALARARAAEDEFACHRLAWPCMVNCLSLFAVHDTAPYGIIRPHCPGRGNALSVPAGVSRPGLNGKQVRGPSQTGPQCLCCPRNGKCAQGASCSHWASMSGKATHPSGHQAGTAHEPGDRPERGLADVPRGGGDGRGGFSCSLRFDSARGASM